jgi:hypothetical protein
MVPRASTAIEFIDFLVKWNKSTCVMFCSMAAGKTLDVFFFSTRKAQDVCWEVVVDTK